VDSVEAERSVLAILDLLCKPGGRLFFSARKRERIEDMKRVSRAAGNGRAVEFLDSNGFTALYRKGQWFYQRFHTKEELHAIADRHGWKIDALTESSTTWNVSATSARNVLSITEYKAAIRFDFNLPVNGAGRRLGMADEMTEAMRCTLK
ncbi:MAG: ParB N-terminal domain-containing protein, partial [Vulcanimicrobiaceae bacterium]